MDEARIDLIERVVVAPDGERVSLTPLEVQVLELLVAAKGAPVARTTLERDVWGLSERARSEAVPVAMRRLRAKVGGSLETVRGFGWTLRQTEPKAGLPGPPRPTLPWMARPDLAQRLHTALASTGRVAVVGAPGIGKTRLVQESAPEAAWIALPEGVHPPSRLLDALAQALGTHRSDPGTLARALADAAPTCLVLDGGQALQPDAAEVMVTLTQASRTPLIVVCREAPTATGWAVLPLPPLSPAQSEALFLLRSGTPADEALHPILERCDGIPGAIELVAAQAWMGPAVLAHMPLGGLASAIATGLERLDPAHRRSLAFLGALGMAVGVSELSAHPQVLGSIPELIRRGLVQPVTDGRLRVLGPIATACLARPEVASAAREAWEHLVERAEEAAARVGADPRAALDTLESLLDGLDAVIHHAGPVLAARAALALCPVARRRGPVTAHRRRIEAALEHAPPPELADPLRVEHVALVCAEGRGSAEQIEGLASIDTPRSHQVRGIYAETTGRMDEALAHYARAVEVAGTDDGVGLLCHVRILMEQQVRLGAPVEHALAELAAVQARFEHTHADLVPSVLRYRVLLTLRTGDFQGASALAARDVQLVEAQGIRRQICSAWNTFGMCLLEHDVSQAEHAFGRALLAGRRMGDAATVYAVNQAWCLCCLGRPSEALALLEPFEAHSARMRPLADLIGLACHLQLENALDATRIRLGLQVEGLNQMFAGSPSFGRDLVDLVELIGSDRPDADEVLARCEEHGRAHNAGVVRGLLAFVRSRRT